MRAPWRWRWGRILALIAATAAWILLIRWSAFFAIPYALWLGAKVIAGDTEPRSPTAPAVDPNAPTRYIIEKRYGNAQTTFTPEAVAVGRRKHH